MTTPSNANAGANGHEWTRVSSFKPQIAAVLLVAAAASVFSVLLDDSKEAFALAAGALAAGTGLIALACKVVHRRGNDYRISTLFYSEVVTVDDVCMTVTKPGPFWMCFRIHLRRPARFGWMISFVPVGGEVGLSAPNRA
jgi:hypothetical protein